MWIVRDLVWALLRIEAWVDERHPDRLPLFRPGANSQTIQRIEASIGKPMPVDIRLLYAAHDGQPEGAPSLYLNQRWLPLDLVAVAWEDLNARYASVNTDGIFWSTDWLPIFGNPRGDHYCVDLRPEQSESGRIVWFLYDQPERTVIARNITQMLRRVADGLESGRWHLDDGYDGFSD